MKFYLPLRSRKYSSDQTNYDKYAILINGTLSIKKLIKKKNYLHAVWKEININFHEEKLKSRQVLWDSIKWRNWNIVPPKVFSVFNWLSSRDFSQNWERFIMSILLRSLLSRKTRLCLNGVIDFTDENIEMLRDIIMEKCVRQLKL